MSARSSRRTWAQATLAMAVVAATVSAPPASASAQAASEPPTKQDVTRQDVRQHRLTLVTGDVVTLTTRPGDDHPAISLDPTGPSRGTAEVTRTDKATYVVPLAANEAVTSNAVDLALFDVKGLVESGYDDAKSDSLPVLLDNRAGRAEPNVPTTARVRNRLESIRSLGARVPKRQASAFWRANDTAAERKAARVGKIWLDAKVSVTLADSVPQIGGPVLWQAGHDGKGVTVAVLDTGVDATHPDLKGRVSATRNFTDSPDAGDHFGHGTHVAATIGGSGAGNGAKGVAPGADLINGKVLGDSGSGTYSSIIDGMEWAAENGADVINMSLGTPVPDDGNGPISAAVNRLTEQYGSLFVVAAGNSGPNTIGAAELSAACGLDADDTVANLMWLRDHGLVLRAKALAITGVPDRWSAAEPDHALRDLVRARERTLHDVRTVLPELQERFRQAHHDSVAGQVLEHVHGWENVGARYHQILRDAAEEVALLDHRPYTPGNAPTEKSILNRGIRFRVMCDPVDLPQQLADEFAALRGLQARLHPDVPFRGVIADRKIALITMDRAPQNMSAIVVRPSPLLDGLVLLFDACWSRAVPLGMDATALDVQALQVLKLLAAGLKDEAIARQLSTTTRTVRRRVQDVLAALHAKSRFHAGVEASRRGWV